MSDIPEVGSTEPKDSFTTIAGYPSAFSKSARSAHRQSGSRIGPSLVLRPVGTTVGMLPKPSGRSALTSIAFLLVVMALALAFFFPRS
jgi:hypothetical protein